MSAEPLRIAFIRGGPDDESGPELADAAMAVLDMLFEHVEGPALDFVPIEAGAHCFAEHGTSLPRHSLEAIKKLGLVFKAPTASARTAAAEPISLMLRRELNAYASVNEMRSFSGVTAAISPNIDIVLVRQNTEGLFAGNTVRPSNDLAVDLRFISREASRKVAHTAFQLAARRSKRLTICAFPVGIDSDKLFIQACQDVAEEYPEVECWVRKVDALAGTIVSAPEQYDVIVTPNEWGSILTDEIAAVCGSVGLAARGNVGDRAAYFEPIHGTAPGKAGKGTVNPVSQIMAGKMLLEHVAERSVSATAHDAAQVLDAALVDVLSSGEVLTGDLGGTATTRQMVDVICDAIRDRSSPVCR